MKAAEKKGKLFGKLNIVDLIVIILIVAAIVVLCVKFLGSGSTLEEEEQPLSKITFTVLVSELYPETYENVCQYVNKETGLKEQLMSNGNPVEGCYIVDVSATEHIHTISDTVGGDTLDVLFTIEAMVSDPDLPVVGSQEVRIGRTHNVKSVHMEFQTGVVITCEWEEIDTDE